MSQLPSIFFNVLTPVFTVILVGYFAGPRLRLDVQSLTRLAYFVLVPAFVFDVISKADFPAGLAVRMVLFVQVIFVACALAAWIVARLLGRSPKVTAAYMLIASFANVGNFGLPIIQFRLGDRGLEAATVFFVASVFISFAIGVTVANWHKGGSLGALLAVLKTPALLAVPPALLVNALNITLPLALARPITLIGSAMIPVMILTLGVQLAGIKVIKFTPDVVISSGVRLLIGPALALLLAVPFGLTGLERGAGILQASMPTAILASLIALQHDLLPDFVTTTVLFSTLASALTLTVMLAIV
jgi:predicted permease